MTKGVRQAKLAESKAPRNALSYDAAQPRLALLSNGRYGVIITAAGAGVSTWRGLDVTRWREDVTRDCWGQFCYVRDLTGDKDWSVGYQPLCRGADEYEVAFHADRVKIRRRDGDIETRWAVCVAPDADAEVRAVTLVNHSGGERELELTSYAEVCLNNRRADQAHPAFAKLFLETQFDKPTGALLARRRPRGENEKPFWAVHVATSNESADGALEFETDRLRFLGRGRTPANPAAMDRGALLSNTTGPVLDPIFSLRRRVHLEPGASARIAFVTGAAETREAATAIVEQFRNVDAVDQAFSAALANCQRELQELSLIPEDIAQFNLLAGAVVFTNSTMRQFDAIKKNRLGQPGLWPHAISGDLPIVLVRVADAANESLVRDLIKWHGYARRRGVEVDFVIMDERDAENREQLKKAIQAGASGHLLGKPGGLYVLTAADVSGDDATLIAAAARVVICGRGGSLASQLDSQTSAASFPPSLVTSTSFASASAEPPTVRINDLKFWNGFGGFSPDGREYVIVVDCAKSADPALPPAPWSNVIANPNFGCLVTEAGLGYTWAGNSQMNRLTPWSNDPTSDPPGEVVYLRDEETGEVWTPTPLPRLSRSNVTVQHGQGYTRYTHHSHGLQQELLVFVPIEDPIKVMRLKVRNDDSRTRRLSATYYAEWVLGSVRENAAMQVVCERDDSSGAVLARSAWAGPFAGKLAFVATGPKPQSVTADRTEFLGRNGSVAAPAALERVELSGRFGSLDPCAALMTDIALAPGETKEVIFVIGQADDLERARGLVRAYTDPGRASSALAEVEYHWDKILQAIQVSTPDVGLNFMLNRWLLYQILACRVWARSAFYQSGGAYGFRDQLQDVMALVYSAPIEARAHILRSAARQFEEGDVQHWWHTPVGAGVRTRITDDLYFLPLAVHHYVATTGDIQLLDKAVPYIKSPVLRDDQEEELNVPSVTAQMGTIYEHCVRALEHGYRLGEHGLPLMGTGDWNDGMNKVGARGKGESVWNGWFFISVLNAFAKIAKIHGDNARAAWCEERAEALRVALEDNAWDGNWYRRAYFDDGTPLGSSQNAECKIDAIPQAWAVISGAADAKRTQLAMNAVEKRLVRPDDKLIQLFDPPFDTASPHPGYIKGYVPGIRENGGQYTHAATWVVLATALQGDGNRALELWNLINPVYHATTPVEAQHYKVEPYVVCADVYSARAHTGRGGWSWYTGSASWLYRVALEAILGFKLQGNRLQVAPCIPRNWPTFEMTYRYGTAIYRIVVDNSARTGRGVRSVKLDGKPMPDGTISLCDDGATHEVRVDLG